MATSVSFALAFHWRISPGRADPQNPAENACASSLASSCRKTTVFSCLPKAIRGYKISIRYIPILPPVETKMIIDRYERPVEGVEPTVTDPILEERDGILDDPQLL